MYLVSKVNSYLSDTERKLKPLNMTAVEYLAKQYDWLLSLELTQKVSGPVIDKYRNKFLKKAKEMEREQKLQFAEDYHKSKLNND